MLYSAAILASVLAMSVGSAEGFQTRTGRIGARAIRMSAEEPWFPNSVTTNVVELDVLG